jgi:hypothetical protein
MSQMKLSQCIIICLVTRRRRRKRANMRAFGSQIVLMLVCCCGALLPQSSPTHVSGQASVKAQIDASVTPRKCKLGEPASIHFQIANVGSVPFYVPSIIDGYGRGGFDIEVFPPPGHPMIKTSRALDPGPGTKFNIIEESARWIVLRPGDFYGATRRLNKVLLPSPGRFTVVVQYDPPGLNDEEKSQLQDTLKFPVLIETIKSAPVDLDVVR